VGHDDDTVPGRGEFPNGPGVACEPPVVLDDAVLDRGVEIQPDEDAVSGPDVVERLEHDLRPSDGGTSISNGRFPLGVARATEFLRSSHLAKRTVSRGDDSPRCRAIRILHVDDDPAFGRLTVEFLEREDDRFQVETESSATAALDRLLDGADGIDCVISDYRMAEMNGIEFLRAFRDAAPNAAVPFVLLTERGSEEVAAEALNAGASSYVQKGTAETYDYLAERVRCDVESARVRRDSDRFGTLVRALDDGFYVADDGSGLTAGDRGRLSEPGYTAAEDGIGYGLAIVAEIAGAHGWEVDATTSRDGGARVEVGDGDRSVGGGIDDPDPDANGDPGARG
jgi:CheY-like chemotaxis protein